MGRRNGWDRDTNHPITRHCCIKTIVRLLFYGKKLHSVASSSTRTQRLFQHPQTPIQIIWFWVKGTLTKTSAANHLSLIVNLAPTECVIHLPRKSLCAKLWPFLDPMTLSYSIFHGCLCSKRFWDNESDSIACAYFLSAAFQGVDVDTDPICLPSARGDFDFVLMTPHAELALLQRLLKPLSQKKVH